MKLFPAQIWIIAACFLSDVISHTLAASNMHRKSVSLTDYGFWKIAGETFGSKTTNSEKLKRNLEKIRRTVAGLSERWRWRDGFQNSGIPSQVSICNHIINQITINTTNSRSWRMRYGDRGHRGHMGHMGYRGHRGHRGKRGHWGHRTDWVNSCKTWSHWDQSKNGWDQ